MDIKLDNINGVAIVTVGGNINMDNCNELRDAFKKVLKDGKTKVLIDLAKVVFIDSSGIASLIEMFQNLEKVGGKMRLCHVNKNIIGLFEITKVHKLFGIFENREEALKEF
ncbi:MAG: STAS domain-containing protein [Candidatus Omnitrophica bacterium]|nr:STAS domain-containing protein [Candidatus Omnitrophota bacterium]